MTTPRQYQLLSPAESEFDASGSDDEYAVAPSLRTSLIAPLVASSKTAASPGGRSSAVVAGDGVNPESTSDSKAHLAAHHGDGDGDNDGADQQQVIPNRHAKLVLISMSLVQVMACAVYAIMAPFFETFAKKDKDVSESLSGLIFAIFSFSIFLVSPATGAIMSRIGRKRVLIIGMCVEAFATVAFAFADKAPSGVPFVLTCFFLRGLAGVGNALVLTSALAIAIMHFPNSRGMIIGIGELSQGVGLLSSPPIGGFLYDAGGFMAPFLFVGGLLLLLMPVVLWTELRPTTDASTVRNIEAEPHTLSKKRPLRSVQVADGAGAPSSHDNLLDINSFSDFDDVPSIDINSLDAEKLPLPQRPVRFAPEPTLGSMLRVPRVWLALLSVVLTISAVTFFDPTLADYFGDKKRFGYSSGIIGLMFLAMSGTYALFAPVAGHFADKNGHSLIMMALGSFGAAICYLLIGPSPMFDSFMPVPVEWLEWIAMLLLGAAMSLIVVPSGPEMISVCKKFDQGDKLSDLIAGLLASSGSLGQAIGPLCGGAIAPTWGFPWGTSLFGFMLIGMGAIQMVVLGVTRGLERKRKAESSEYERQHLLAE
ncbi:hypothetical protein CAOG_02148 [Capsaspora owczarzaki ATCC 30864]|uniref:Major facilitator superfamily (MFS) profile domain-containing protein n=1 Tax=Capsaspora owczarzaki (strain ATCC 30864) TaxID=595528 RepID=A0A0D2VLC8_CAPO3|nr:hypothetical protein CAOG_02148 [Capsaspora owczarzaki ATCC 30864]KJE90917.1 hypothetical protein CAOG_002148 [Capsaspora owczarzaki ATCC 30864]|eukprot:XP_004348898.2 hypothetical protein CAOG_02148 [Capsaspora owczarzaki ATCC 30864]